MWVVKAKSRVVKEKSRVVKEKSRMGKESRVGKESREVKAKSRVVKEYTAFYIRSVKLVSFGTVATYNMSDQRHIIGSKMKNSSSNQNFHFLLR